MSSSPESHSESESDSSTVVYDHETFPTFKTRVLALCQTVLGPTPSSEISIERLRGGGFNRIIGISVMSNGKTTTAVNRYILRIPRFEAAQLDRDLAPLQLLRQRSKIKVPDVVYFDTTIRNAIESPYMIQTRIPGTSLYPAYPDLPHTMRCAIAKELGNVFFELHSIRSVAAGSLALSSSKESLMILPFHDADTASASPYEDGPAIQTTLEMLRASLEYKKSLSLAEGPENAFKVSFFNSFTIMASEMSALGVFDENYFCLCHLDLEPRNILVSPPSPTQSQAITGILDWDSALFAPQFMSCSPPMWLWAWNDDEDEDERLANEMPPTPELRELKQFFEDAAGLDYNRFAYGGQYRLARRLVRFAIDGLRSNEDLIGAESLLNEWSDVQASLKKVLVATT